jgi:hypothetical protein
VKQLTLTNRVRDDTVLFFYFLPRMLLQNKLEGFQASLIFASMRGAYHSGARHNNQTVKNCDLSHLLLTLESSFTIVMFILQTSDHVSMFKTFFSFLLLVLKKNKLECFPGSLILVSIT